MGRTAGDEVQGRRRTAADGGEEGRRELALTCAAAALLPAAAALLRAASPCSRARSSVFGKGRRGKRGGLANIRRKPSGEERNSGADSLVSAGSVQYCV